MQAQACRVALQHSVGRDLRPLQTQYNQSVVTLTVVADLVNGDGDGGAEVTTGLTGRRENVLESDAAFGTGTLSRPIAVERDVHEV